jgi:MFS family permease
MSHIPTFPVVLAGFAAFLVLYATQPLLPLLAATFGASAFDVSLTVTAPTIAVALAAPLVGRLGDRYGLRPVMILSAFGLALATGLAATASGLWWFVVWRFVQGLFTPGIFAIAIAYIHEQWPASRVGRATSAYVSGTVFGGFSGRALTGLVTARFGWPTAFAVLAAVSLAAATALLAWLPRARPAAANLERHRARAGAILGPALRLLRNPLLVATYVVGFCVLFTQVAMFTYVTFHLAAAPFRLSTAALGSLFAVYLVGAVITPLAGPWIDAWGHRAGLAGAMGISACGALLTLLPSLAAILAGLALTATGVFISQAAASSYIGAATVEDRGLAVGMYATFYYAGGSIGGAAPAALWARGGWTACVALVLLVQALTVAIAVRFWGPRGALAVASRAPESPAAGSSR